MNGPQPHLGAGVDLGSQVELAGLERLQREMADRQTRLACIDLATRCRESSAPPDGPDGQYVLNLAHAMFHFVNTGQKGRL